VGAGSDLDALSDYDSDASGYDDLDSIIYGSEPKPIFGGAVGTDDVGDQADGFPDPPLEGWSPSHSPSEWASMTWTLIPTPLRKWIKLYEPSMRVGWETMYTDRRTMLPVLESFVTDMKPEERLSAMWWLFDSKGLLPVGGAGANMFADLFCGFRQEFGKLDYRIDDDMREARYYLAVADKFLSLADGGGFSRSLVWDPLPRVIDPPNFRAGGIHSKQAKAAWHQMDKEGPGVSKWVLQWVDNRVWFERMKPLEEDHSARNAKCFSDPEKKLFMRKKVEEMLRVGAVVKLPRGQRPKVLTRLSLAPKAGTGDRWRVIMDMRPENAMYRKYKVKMEHLDHVPTVIAEGDLLYSLDLKSAYYSVGVDPRLGATMGFEWEGEYYRFMVLPFGFTGSPYAFVKVGRNILKKWRAVGPGEWSKRFGACMDASMRAGSKAMLYIDDTLGAHEHFVGAIWQRNAQMLELEKLGFSLSSKGELLPFPSVKFLGMLIHLGRKVPSWHVPKDKLDNIRRVADELIEDMGEAGRVACTKAAKCIGKLVSASRAVPIGRLLFRELNLCIYSNGRPWWGGSTVLSAQALLDLRFIIRCLTPYNLRGSPIWVSSVVERVDVLLIQDSGPSAVGFALHEAPDGLQPVAASLDGLPVVSHDPTWWGRHVTTSSEVQPVPDLELATSIGTIPLTEAECDLAHVQKELLGTYLALKSRRRELHNKRVCIFVDAVATIAYLIKWGGPSMVLCRIVRLIWGVCVRWGIRIVQVSHISGKRMITAGVDALSRPPRLVRKCEADRDEWRLTEDVFVRTVQALAINTFGYCLSIDRFATRSNTRLKRFNSISSVDPNAEAWSAFETAWGAGKDGREISYAFPPFFLIGRVLQHIRQCGAKAVIIVPQWPSQSWWVNLAAIAVNYVTLSRRPVFERPSEDGQWQPVTKQSFTAMAVAVDGAVGYL
jgi:hypothetical protein